MVGVRKRIAGARGRTLVGRAGVAFDVVGHELRYRAPLQGLVDVLEPASEGWSGRALFRGEHWDLFAEQSLRQEGVPV